MWFSSVCHATSETHSCVATALLAAETPEGEIVVQGGTVVAEAYVAQEQESDS